MSFEEFFENQKVTNAFIDKDTIGYEAKTEFAEDCSKHCNCGRPRNVKVD